MKNVKYCPNCGEPVDINNGDYEQECWKCFVEFGVEFIEPMNPAKIVEKVKTEAYSEGLKEGLKIGTKEGYQKCFKDLGND